MVSARATWNMRKKAFLLTSYMQNIQTQASIQLKYSILHEPLVTISSLDSMKDARFERQMSTDENKSASMLLERILVQALVHCYWRD